MESLRAINYRRASLDFTGEGRSVERQGEANAKLVDLRGWTEVACLTDNNVSAYGTKVRPDFQRALDMLRADEADVIVAWHLDRITRNMNDLERLIKVCEDHGKLVVTSSGDFDLSSDTGRMVARILAAIARGEVERKAARQRLANAQRAKDGKPWAGGARPFGYSPDQMDLIPAEAAAIQSAAQDVLLGVSLSAIARRWEEQGLASSRSSYAKGGWTGKGVRGVLLSPRYAGLREYNGEVIGPALWPAILDDSTHRQLVKKLDDPRRLTHSHRTGRKAANLLTSIAYCSVCEATVAATSLRGQRIYACIPHRHVVPPRAECDRAVEEMMVAYLSTPDKLAALMATGNEDDEAQAALAELARIDADLEELAELLASKALTVAAYAAAASALEPEREAAEHRLARADRTSVLDGLTLGTPLVLAQWERLTLERKRAIVGRFLNVELRPAGKRKDGIAWNVDAHVRIEPKLSAG